jgi:penicillin-binding protein 1A
LAQKIGMEAIINKAEELGITSEMGKNYATAIGASNVCLLEISACYGATMTGGVKMNPFGIISIRNQQGKILYRAYQQNNKRVISREVCEKMKIIMRELVDRGTGRRAKLPIPAYAKTGTSNDSRDASFIGFAYPLVAGVWLGNDDNSPMNRKMTGGVLPAMVWRDFMLTAFGYNKSVREVQIEQAPKHAQTNLQKPQDLNKTERKKRDSIKSLVQKL